MNEPTITRRRLAGFAAAAAFTAALPLQASASSPAFSFTDLAGRSVTLSKKPERFIVANYIANFMMVGGAQSVKHIVGLTMDGWEATRYGEYSLFMKAFPQLAKAESIGGYHDNILNSEKILALKPDVLLIGLAQYADNSQRIEIFERAGIRVVVLDYHAMKTENHVKSTQILGALLGRETTAAAQCRRYESVLSDIHSRIAALTEGEKHRRVYVECGNRGVGEYGNSYNSTILWGGILKNLAAENIAGSMKQPYGALDREFVVASNPQTVIIAGSIWQNGTEGDQMRMGLTVTEAEAQKRLAGFAARPLWQGLDAVRTGEVYAVDHGSLRCMADYTFSMYLAKVLYPKTFADFDPQAEMTRFYGDYLPELQASGTFFLKLAR